VSLGLTLRPGSAGAEFENLTASSDTRDGYTAGHSRRVRMIALAIGAELRLRGAELAAVGRAALFHDIGKLAVPEEILLKPADLTDAEWVVMRRHSDDGARMLESVGVFADAVPGVRHHHERYDGSGYPRGLAGHAIPLAARIVHVADALDSMLTARPYRPGRSPGAALTELRAGRGTQFCPDCLGALERAVASGSLAELGVEPGEPALVV
jgi:putative nucleotidyltransferase with HDIG domain